MRALPLLLLVPILSASACSTYSVRRSALVPHAAPVARSGQPVSGRGELAFSSPRVASLGSPEEGDGANAGLYVPRAQVAGELRIGSINPDLDLGLIYDHGLAMGATAITPDQPQPDNGDVYGGGASAHWSPEVSPGVRLGVGLMTILYSVPFIEYRTCVDNCSGQNLTDIERGRKSVGILQASLAPSLRRGAVTYFASMTIRNHPTNTKGEVTSDPYFDDSDEIRSGPANFIAGAGIEIDFGKVRALAQVFMPLNQQPVSYRPTLGVGITLPFGRPRSAPPAYYAQRQ
jgi:hypothetical protein